MTPTLITPPASMPVTLLDVKEHLRVDHDEEDALISGLISAAVAHLDGRAGVLGRCIMPQTWRVSAEAGDVVLPFPDVTAASVDYGDGAVALDVTATGRGPMVTLDQDGDITFTCAMPAHLLPAIKGAVMMLVAHWYATREAASGAMAPVPMAADALISALRWVRI